MADIIHLARTAHDEAQLLMPWYVNGTLDPDAAELVEAHLAECADCRHDAEAERTLCRDITELPLAAERGRSARDRRIDGPSPRASVTAFLRRRVSVGWALAGQLATAAALVVAILTPSTSQPQGATYQTLSSPRDRSAGNAVIVFDPAQTERDMRAALIQVDAQIVDGPNASGAYVLSIPPAQRRDALDELRGLPNVVLAEPIDRAGEP